MKPHWQPSSSCVLNGAEGPIQNTWPLTEWTPGVSNSSSTSTGGTFPPYPSSSTSTGGTFLPYSMDPCLPHTCDHSLWYSSLSTCSHEMQAALVKWHKYNMSPKSQELWHIQIYFHKQPFTGSHRASSIGNAICLACVKRTRIAAYIKLHMRLPNNAQQPYKYLNNCPQFVSVNHPAA